jgi:hypothetical protein
MEQANLKSQYPLSVWWSHSQFRKADTVDGKSRPRADGGDCQISAHTLVLLADTAAA